MNRLFLTCAITLLLSCSPQKSDNKTAESSPDSLNADRTVTPTTEAVDATAYMTSTYDNIPNDNLDQHRVGLKELSDSAVFSTIHRILLSALDKKHQSYFASKPGYELLYSATGDLLQNGKNDNAFIAYDKNHFRISILVYDELQNAYAELFRDIKVRNGLANANCNYGAYGTLDYQIAAELIYHRDYLIKKPESYIEYSKCKITDVTQDDDLVLDEGCFAPTFSPDKQTKALCLPTSSVYNNWECLTYDKEKKVFVIFYGQAFAD